jgi:hypothetical protein
MCKLSFFLIKFQVVHLETIIGQRLFEYLKPFFVKLLKDRNTCCIYHAEFDELQLALNLLRTKNAIHDKQGCECCCDNVCGLNGQQCQASCAIYNKASQNYGKFLSALKMNMMVWRTYPSIPKILLNHILM